MLEVKAISTTIPYRTEANLEENINIRENGHRSGKFKGATTFPPEVVAPLSCPSAQNIVSMCQHFVEGIGLLEVPPGTLIAHLYVTASSL